MAGWYNSDRPESAALRAAWQAEGVLKRAVADPGRVAQCECCYTTCKAAPLHPKHESVDCAGKFCGACAANFYRGQLEDGMWNLRCPSVGCTAAPHDGTMALLPGGAPRLGAGPRVAGSE